MFKPPSYTVGGSTKVEAEKLGDHITADFIITRDEEEVGMDDERNALVVKDVATGFTYVYPNARRTTNAAALALKHFVGHNYEVGVFYSDNAPELISAMKVLQWRHVLSRDYISKSNAQAERAVRSVLEGTRVNLLQSGLNHWHWPHAARLVLDAEYYCNGREDFTLGIEVLVKNSMDQSFHLDVLLTTGPDHERRTRTISGSILHQPRYFPWLRSAPRI